MEPASTAMRLKACSPSCFFAQLSIAKTLGCLATVVLASWAKLLTHSRIERSLQLAGSLIIPPSSESERTRRADRPSGLRKPIAQDGRRRQDSKHIRRLRATEASGSKHSRLVHVNVHRPGNTVPLATRLQNLHQGRRASTDMVSNVCLQPQHWQRPCFSVHVRS